MPIEALINADAEAAKTFAAFIHEYGFERPGPGGGGNRPYGKLKMVSFSYYRPVAGGQPQAFQVEVPLILLIPLPTLAIRDAQLDFSVEIFGMVDKQSSDPVRMTATRAVMEKRQRRPPHCPGGCSVPT